jgi:hypothetical protein
MKIKGETMRKINTLIAAGLLGGIVVAGLTGCATDADTVNHNLDVDAEGFKITRDIKFINGITDTTLLEVSGKCSIDTGDSDLAGSLQVTCKVQTDDGPKYVKHFLILSDNVTATVEQILPSEASEYNYEFVVKPEGILPDIQVDTKIGDEAGQ